MYARISGLVLLLNGLLFGPPLAAETPPCEFTEREKACLALEVDRTAYEPGQTVTLTARVSIAPGWHVNSHTPTLEYLIPTTVDFRVAEDWPPVQPNYPPGEMQVFAFSGQPISVYDAQIEITATTAVAPESSHETVPVVAELRYQACTDDRCLPPVETSATIGLVVGERGQPTGTLTPQTFGGTWLLMLGFALLGGIILNAMPCVLPVLSLKLLSIAKSAGSGRGQTIRTVLATSLGIIVSFWVLAGVAISLKLAGAAVGWGIQFQEPLFVASLCVVVVAFCLNLWGVFEVSIPGVASRIGSAGPTQGWSGDFTTGAFTTLMATPCTAPFLGTAVGFALAQSNMTVLTIFTAVGVGMALPYLVLAAVPGAVNLLPRPGAWMVRLKVILGFLLAGAAVWLLFVLSGQLSAVRVASIQLSLLALALFVWLRSETKRSRALFTAAAIAAMVCTVWLAGTGETSRSISAPAHTLIDWQPFDRIEARQLADAGELVFIEVTADWCFTCKINEKLVLETPEIANAFERSDVLAMQADWTNPNDEITTFLAEHGRAGIPFYALYGADGYAEVLSELLTKSEVLEALQRATAGTR